MTWVDLVMVGLLGFALYSGTKRGFVLIGLELISFVLATAIALLTYHPVGGLVQAMSGLSTPLSHVVAFVLIWMIAEITLALLARLGLGQHFTPHRIGPWNRAGGAILNLGKATLIIMLGLIVFAGLPLSAAVKDHVTGAPLPKILLASSGRLQAWLGGGLGQDLGATLNFFTVDARPQSEELIRLGYTTTGSVDEADEAAMLTLLNHERTKRGLAPLKLNEQARSVARSYSADMFARGYFSHINPEGRDPFDRLREAGVRFGAAGENLALAPTLQLAHEGLMNSPGHRANILGEQYRAVGIGIINGGPYGLMVSQEFTD